MSNDNPFNVIGGQVDEAAAKLAATEIATGFDETNTVERIKKIIGSHSLVLFVKGNALFPQCGFSKNAIAIFSHLGADFKTYDILRDPELRQEIKSYSNWPTFPQVYHKGELLGGNDIITEMFQTGELAKLFS